MRLGLHARFGPGTRLGWDAVHAALAFTEHAHVSAYPVDPLPPGPYPSQFRRLLLADEPDVHLYLGDPSDPPVHGATCWAYPGHGGARADGWAHIIATNPDDASLLDTDDIAPMGVTVDGFPFKARRNRVVLVLGDADVDLPFERLWRNPDTMTERGLAYVCRMATVAVVVDPKYAWAAARFMATGGILVAPPKGDLGSLVIPDWAVPLTEGQQVPDAVDDALRVASHHMRAAAADYIRSGLSWDTCTERVSLLLRRRL